MSTYKVRLGEHTVEVDGLAGLLALVQQGKLGPDDPVYVPATGRWHYARAVRQLREHFPLAPAPPPVPSEKKETPREPAPEGASVLPLRPARSRFTPSPSTDGGIPVFAYDVDLDSDGRRRIRVLLLVLLGTVLVGLTWVYQAGYAAYMRDFSARLTPPPPVPTPAGRAGAGPPGPSLPSASPSARPTPLYDPAEVVARLRTLRPTASDRPDRMGAAMKTDLVRLGVPVRAVSIAPHGSGRGKLPFACVIVQNAAGLSARSLARQRYLVIAYAGERMGETRINVDLLEVQTLTGAKKPPRVKVPLDLARRAALGQAGADEVDALFR